MRRRLHRPRPLWIAGLLATVALVASACSDDDGASAVSRTDATSEGPTGSTGQDDPTPGTDAPVDLGDLRLTSFLQAFEGCDAFLDRVQGEALDRVGPYGLDGFGGPVIMEDGVFTTSAGGNAAGDESASTMTTVPAAAGDGDVSGTNVQEVGVDEPDIVKSDSTRIVALAAGSLQYVDLTGEAPELAGSLRLPDADTTWANSLLVEGDRALVIAGGGAYGAGGSWSDTTSLFLVDLGDGTDMQVVERLEVDGSYLSARMIDGTVRLVLRSAPVGLEWAYPEGSGLRAERDATEHNRQVIRDSTIDNWVPYVVREDGSGLVLDEGPLLDCDSVHHPEDFSGFGMLDVVTIDLADPARGLDPGPSVGILTGGETVYASTSSLYVVTTDWVDPETYDPSDDVTSAIHRFDISDPDALTYESSGEVPGYVLNQFALSEWDGHLRVATTEADPWGLTDSSESFVSVLEEQGDELATVGRVGDLGRGERIYSVRFVGDAGYVVTFRQTDPLYTVDLSDPTAPRVVGELELLGYSAYLHPAGDGLLIGVGQDADDQGRVQGTQVSLFDVSDPAAPVRLQNHAVPDGWSEAEYDHHAFLYWQPTGLTVIPVTVYPTDGQDEMFSGALGLSVSPDGIDEIARITHDPDGQQGPVDLGGAPIHRSLVVGDRLYTVSDAGIEAHDLNTLADTGALAFG